ncbi:prepilin-type N-terminal cleavage/methylation domain-containing protein [SAR92 clade bacterium H231]|nr:prepilin-type N-terminal cleavage/methylation domain-containing protein [SAR92 clade bacterium H231]
MISGAQSLFSRHRSGRGFTLIEVLVSLLIFSIGLMGYTHLSLVVQSRQLEVTQRLYAIQMLDLLAAQLAADPESRQQTKNQFSQWNTLVESSGLLNGRACIDDGAIDGSYTVAVAWQGLTEVSAQPASSCGAGEYGTEGLRRVISRSISIPAAGSLGSGGGQ